MFITEKKCFPSKSAELCFLGIFSNTILFTGQKQSFRKQSILEGITDFAGISLCP
jgi:hypothetical protein